MTSVAVTCLHLQRHFDKFRPLFEKHGIRPILPSVNGQQLGAAEIRQVLPGMATIIAGDDIIDREALAAAKELGLKAVIKWGIGTDSIDKAAAHELGIPVFNTPGVFGEEVADLALSYLLLLTRGLHRMDRSVRDGGWLKVEGRSLHAMTAGVIGLGSIGRAIARRCAACGMKVVGSDAMTIDAASLAQSSITQLSFEEVLAEADVVILACALTQENRHLMNADAFARMKQGSYLVNVGRGPLVDEAALAATLNSGKLAGAGLDVFEVEPLPADSPLRTFDGCVFGTHNGSNTRDAVDRVNRMTVEIALDVLGCQRASFEPNRVA
ncbi:phosphoglycerate dehydrogenase [Hyphomicrobium sp.]|jgi:D-3-phosphoglycerate dehydrogenase|uniref:phosphoglycerate dehydrogenase n=1 Tax=Hyphomicrobium sp. TaxID=82 RepID=UPI002C8A2757|nr:phosphoglycerate dehydrogenase [Hyphomicrobium sp.]HVU21440.1 phosphoglycerate dehydrogenase [Rhizomicrobium sp.]HVX35934.1 phosphoglycerate dehydrogenase [Hyphomicrobium sp.]HVZ03552.1 phosphoglycerate dehydrogenase [Hyphomicrobium sp.]